VSDEDGQHGEPRMSQPRIFEHPFQVSPTDIDRLGHVNNVVYLRYAQDAAVAHWNAAVTKEARASLVWVVRRHEIDYLKPALENDDLVARTWIGEASGATMERFIEIRRAGSGDVMASVRSVWVALDAKTLRPRRVTAELRSYFLEGKDSASGST
jgi:acyl-CoA thioester hydrolase